MLFSRLQTSRPDSLASSWPPSRTNIPTHSIEHTIAQTSTVASASRHHWLRQSLSFEDLDLVYWSRDWAWVRTGHMTGSGNLGHVLSQCPVSLVHLPLARMAHGFRVISGEGHSRSDVSSQTPKRDHFNHHSRSWHRGHLSPGPLLSSIPGTHIRQYDR